MYILHTGIFSAGIGHITIPSSWPIRWFQRINWNGLRVGVGCGGMTGLSFNDNPDDDGWRRVVFQSYATLQVQLQSQNIWRWINTFGRWTSVGISFFHAFPWSSNITQPPQTETWYYCIYLFGVPRHSRAVKRLTVWYWNVAMDNPAFIDDFHMKPTFSSGICPASHVWHRRVGEYHSVLFFVYPVISHCIPFYPILHPHKIPYTMIWRFPKLGYPSITHFHRIVHCKSSILEIPHLWKSPRFPCYIPWCWGQTPQAAPAPVPLPAPVGSLRDWGITSFSGQHHLQRGCSSDNLVGGLVAIFIFPYIGNFIIPIDFHIFQRGSNHQPVIGGSMMLSNLPGSASRISTGCWATGNDGTRLSRFSRLGELFFQRLNTVWASVLRLQDKGGTGSCHVLHPKIVLSRSPLFISW